MSAAIGGAPGREVAGPRIPLVSTTFGNIDSGIRKAASAAGCQPERNDSIVHGEDFPAADTFRPSHEYIELEAANAARADGTLRKYHFDAGDLNSLGEERLDLILHSGDSISPLTIYLDLPQADAQTAQRRQTVLAFLKDRGLTDEQINFKYGYNPNSTSPVAPLPIGGIASGPPAAPPVGPVAPVLH